MRTLQAYAVIERELILCQITISIVLVLKEVDPAIGAHRNGQCVTSSRETGVILHEKEISIAKEDGT